MNSKPTLDYISTQLQNDNKPGVLELFKLLLHQNNALKSSLHEINNSIRHIKSASDELNHKLNKLQQHPSHPTTIQQISNINHEINHRSTNIITKYFNNNRKNSQSQSQTLTLTHTNGASCRARGRGRESIILDNEPNNNTITDHDLSRIIRNIENSDNKTDESITFVVEEHMHIDNGHTERRGSNVSNVSNNSDFGYHHRTQTHPELNLNHEIDENSVLSRHGSKQEIIEKLESGGKLLALINKSQTKLVSKKKVVKFLQKKGVSLDKINEAYLEYYENNNLYEVIFKCQPLGFGVNQDEKESNAIVTSIQNKDILQTQNLKIGSIIYEINGKRVDNTKHVKIIQILQAQQCPFYIIFKYDENFLKLQKSQIQIQNETSINSKILHEHSIISHVRKKEDIQDVVPPTDIDWEHVGQILLDHRFLASARLINQALDHLETFCNDEDLHENNWRDELCKAWSLLDDRGIILWQILYGNLKYSEKERRCFYDLMLHFYFKLNDMKTENIVFLCTKILRDMKQDIDLIIMKEILVINKIDGFSFNAEIKNAHDFATLFKCMQHVQNNVWENVYYELVQWKLDENIKNEHEEHQKKYKNKLDPNANFMDFKENYNEITMFNEMTIRKDIDYEDSTERKEWIEYRHNLKNIFRFFAGYNGSHMSKRELNNFLHILDIRKYWTMHYVLQDDMISMDEFIKCLCSEYINSKARDIKKHILKQTEWQLLLNAVKYLEEIDCDKNKKGILQFIDFQQFGKNLGLNHEETEFVFNKIDKRDCGKISIDGVFEWYKKQLVQRKPKRNSKITRRTKINVKDTD